MLVKMNRLPRLENLGGERFHELPAVPSGARANTNGRHFMTRDALLMASHACRTAKGRGPLVQNETTKPQSVVDPKK